MKVYKSTLKPLRFVKESGQILAVKINSSKDAAEYLSELYDRDTIDIQESFHALYLNNSNKVVGHKILSVGGINGSVVYIRLLFNCGIQCLAVGMIISHNHPSGRLKASEADRQITRKVKAAGEVMDIKLLDHIIITPDNKFLSFADEGML